MYDYERIIKDCFWEFKLTMQDIDTIINGVNIDKKKFLFEKILLNSTNLLNDLAIFKQNDLIILIENYQVPKFNYEYNFRRKNSAEVYFLDKPLLIDELKWVA